MKDQFCPQCGKPRQENLKFCVTCGFTFRDRDSNHISEKLAETHEASALLVQVHPWRRFWARFLDDSILGIIYSVFIKSLMLTQYDIVINHLFISFIVYLLTFLVFSIIAESICISYTGTTPGKSLFKIRIQDQAGRNLSFGKSMDRSSLVYMRGRALGLFPLSLAFEWVNKRKLEQNKIASWDRDLKTVVVHRQVERIVYFYFVLIYLLMIVLYNALKNMF